MQHELQLKIRMGATFSTWMQLGGLALRLGRGRAGGVEVGDAVAALVAAAAAAPAGLVGGEGRGGHGDEPRTALERRGAGEGGR